MKRNHLDCDNFLKPSCPKFNHDFSLALLVREKTSLQTQIMTKTQSSNMDGLCEHCEDFIPQ